MRSYQNFALLRLGQQGYFGGYPGQLTEDYISSMQTYLKAANSPPQTIAMRTNMLLRSIALDRLSLSKVQNP